MAKRITLYDLLTEQSRQSKLGYKDKSPYKDAPFLDIKTPSGQITMKGVSQPLLGTTPEGEQKVMLPGQEYSFLSDTVREIPLMQMGGATGGMGGFGNFLNQNQNAIGGIGNIASSVMEGVASNRKPLSPIDQQAAQAAADSPLATAGYALGESAVQGAADAFVPGAGQAIKAYSGLVDSATNAFMSEEQKIKNNGLKFTKYFGPTGYLLDRALGKRKLGKFNARKDQLQEIDAAQNNTSMELNNNSGSGDYSPMYKNGGLTGEFGSAEVVYAKEGAYIKPADKQKFAAWAKSRGMSMQQAAAMLLAKK